MPGLSTNRLNEGFSSKLAKEKGLNSHAEEINKIMQSNNLSINKDDHRAVSQIATDYILNGLVFHGAP